ncbi:MAG: hypothetical protein ACYDAI_11555 [Trichloromonadaceae bacterium]
MSKGKQRIVEPANQLSLFALLSQEVEDRKAEPGAGSANIREKLKDALLLALKEALPKSRWQVAGEMSHLLGNEITKYQIDSWVAESKEGHRIAVEYLPAFCLATGSYAPLQVLNDACKVFTVKGPDALRADIRRDEEAIKAKQAAKRKKESLLAALEGK